MKKVIKGLVRLSYVMLGLLFISNIATAQISITTKKKTDENADLTEEQIAEALQTVTDAIKLKQIQAVMELDLKEVLGFAIGSDDDADISGAGNVSEIQGILNIIGSDDDADISGWGIGTDDDADISGWGIGTDDDADISGWGSLPLTDVENVLKARAIESILKGVLVSSL